MNKFHSGSDCHATMGAHTSSTLCFSGTNVPLLQKTAAEIALKNRYGKGMD